MSSLTYGVYPGLGEWARDNLGYMQAVRIGDRIEISGQGGWNPSSNPPDFDIPIRDEIAQAFENVETALRTVGGKGWEQVYSVESLHTEITPEVTALMTEFYRKFMPNHKPIWTQYGVKQLGLPGMRVEIKVAGYDPEGVGAAAAKA